MPEKWPVGQVKFCTECRVLCEHHVNDGASRRTLRSVASTASGMRSLPVGQPDGTVHCRERRRLTTTTRRTPRRSKECRKKKKRDACQDISSSVVFLVSWWFIPGSRFASHPFDSRDRMVWHRRRSTVQWRVPCPTPPIACHHSGKTHPCKTSRTHRSRQSTAARFSWPRPPPVWRSGPRRGCGGQLHVAVIGHTGRGDYGHGIDTMWLSVPGTEIVAVADADSRRWPRRSRSCTSRRALPTTARCSPRQSPTSWRSACGSIDQHRDVVLAVAEAGVGVRGIYMEKPLCRTPAEADEIVSACERSNVKLAVGVSQSLSPGVADDQLRLSKKAGLDGYWKCGLAAKRIREAARSTCACSARTC